MKNKLEKKYLWQDQRTALIKSITWLIGGNKNKLNR